MQVAHAQKKVLEVSRKKRAAIPEPHLRARKSMSHETELDPRRNPRIDQAAREYCFQCGTPWKSEWVQCKSCGEMEKQVGAARPRTPVSDDKMIFDGPWRLLPWPTQGGVAMHGGPGAGKSTLASLLRPTAWLTSEQEPKPVGEMLRRATPDNICTVYPVKTPEQVRDVLSLLEKGPIVLDSLTGFGLREALVIAHMISNWAKARNDRALAIQQHTKAGEAAGFNEIPHLFDAIVDVTPDKWGVRSFTVTKSRWSPLGSLYWTFDKEGKIINPDFPAAYSVEGIAGNYWLHPYPLRGSQQAGLLAFLNELGLLSPKSASAAMTASYMPSGFIDPMDVHERKRFAKLNGLDWLEPNDYIHLVERQRDIEAEKDSS